MPLNDREIPSPAEPTVLHIRIPGEGIPDPARAVAYANFFRQVAGAVGIDASVIGVPTPDGGVHLVLSEPWPGGSAPSTARPVIGLKNIAETL